MLSLDERFKTLSSLGFLLAALLWADGLRGEEPRIDWLSSAAARPGASVFLVGHGFGAAPGTIVLTGLRVAASAWSETNVSFVVPEDGASGFVRIRAASGEPSADVPFTVERPLPAGQIAPYGLALEETGLPGSALLVETDGACLYGISGFETLSVYALRGSQPHTLRSRVQLNQRVGDLRIRDGFLFCAGDHGLLVYRCADLQAGTPVVASAVAGGSYLGVDVRPDPTGLVKGLLLALCEHAPRWGADSLRVVFYQFAGGELTRLGTYSRTAGADERQFCVALDPRNRKAYVSGWGSLTGSDKYLLELTTTNLANPALQHREDTGLVMAGDMDVLENVLWTAVLTTGGANQIFRAYTLEPGTNHLGLSRVISGGFAFGRVARVRIVDPQVTVGSSWYGNRPDIFLFTTFGSTTGAVATLNSLDWAFDVTGFALPSGTNAGKVVVADEWGGFITLDYQTTPKPGLSHQPDYQWVPSSAMTEGLHLAEGRVFVAGRGAGPWSADCRSLADESRWRHVGFDWTQADPQPHPVSAVCTRRDPEAGLLIAALGHEKAMAWGEEIVGLLYRETASNITLLAQSEPLNPAGLGSEGVSAIWPERDLVFMTTGTDGFRAYVVNPSVPGIAIHQDCQATGFATNIFSTRLAARCLRHYADPNGRKLIVGGKPGPLVGDPTLNIFALSYPQGVPDRDHPDAPITVTHEASVHCLAWKPVQNLDVHPAGLVAVATSAGIGIFPLAWVERLNLTNDFAAWNRVRVPTNAYAPWWHSSWTSDMADVSFADSRTLYVVKATEGVWRLSLELDPTNQTHRCMATAFYPGVECGMDYTRMLHGWGAPDIPTLHHPYGVVADGDTAYVTGWSGKVQRLGLAAGAGVRIQTARLDGNVMEMTFFSPFGNRTYQVETTSGLHPAQWTVRSDVQVRDLGNQTFSARESSPGTAPQFHRIRMRP
jgi:hypothetical protein